MNVQKKYPPKTVLKVKLLIDQKSKIMLHQVDFLLLVSGTVY